MKRKEKRQIIKGALFFIMAFGLICSLKNHIYAKTQKKEVPAGVMANGVNDMVVVSWEEMKNAVGYEIYIETDNRKISENIAATKSPYVYQNALRGEKYNVKVRAVYENASQKSYSKYSKVVTTNISSNATTTLSNFLRTAVAPVGSTMYIWGGGWNKKDTAAGKDAKRIGLNKNWRAFAKKQTRKYDYTKTRYQWGNGLDCSGYVGWVMYNIQNTEPNHKGYVKSAKDQAKWFSQKGYGTYAYRVQVKDFKPGDIMSSKSHVYIVIGSEKDGSVLLVHSSPAGVSLCGTPSKKGKKNSESVRLAKKYMKKYYNSWYRRFPRCDRPSSYMTDFSQMRWKVSGDGIMSDEEGIQQMNAGEVLKILYNE